MRHIIGIITDDAIELGERVGGAVLAIKAGCKIGTGCAKIRGQFKRTTQ